MASKSYGIHVGQLAGLPSSVILRAEQLLSFFLNKKLPVEDPTASLPKGDESKVAGVDSLFPGNDAGISCVEENGVVYIRVNKQQASFADSYEFLCNYYFGKKE